MDFGTKSGLSALGTSLLLVSYAIVNGNLEGMIMGMDQHGVLTAAVTMGFARWLLLAHLGAGMLLPWIYESFLEVWEKAQATFAAIAVAAAPLPFVCVALLIRYPQAENLALVWMLAGLFSVILTALAVANFHSEPVEEPS